MLLTRWLEPKNTVGTPRKTTLRMDWLEARDNPSVTIQFDYSYDTSRFFDQQSRRDELQRAADTLTSQITTSLGAITSNAAAGNNWTLTTFNPSDPFNHNADISITNLNIAADTLVIYVGAETGVGGGEAGLGGYGGYSASGSQPWLDSLRSRGHSGFAPWGGSITFDPNTNWNFSSGAPGAQQIDFQTVAVHELGHVLGFGTAQQYFQYVSGDIFFGPNAKAVNGGANPNLQSNADQEHWRQGTTSNGQPVSMQPVVAAGTRVAFSQLDFAVLSDIGWNVSGFQAPTGPGPTVPTGNIPTPTPIPTSPIVATSFSGAQDPVVVSIGNGSYQLYNASPGGLTAVGNPVNAFPGYTGPVRVATGDINGDGVQDIIVAAGPGGGPHVKVFDGATGQLIRSFFAFEQAFTGGVFLAAADINGDGKADIIVSPDVGGGPRVRVFSAGDPNRELVSFFGIEDPGFFGGCRVAAGDVNGDGVADLVVSAGFGGGPRIAVWDGRLLAQGRLSRVTNDFYAFESTLTNGTYVAVSDVDGDGFGDLVFGAGPGGGPRVRIASGKLTAQQGGVSALNNQLQNFYAGDPNGRGGVRVAGGDFDGNGRGEVLIGSGGGQAGAIYRLTENGLMANPLTNNPLAQGVFVG